MRIIKRYQNRRLYDTENSRTITQFDLAKMIRRGIEVKIVDSVSGRDITADILGRVVLAESTRWGSVKETIELFNDIIVNGGNKSMSLLKNTILASIGMLHVTKAKAEKIIDDLIKRGELDKSSRKKAVMELVTKAEKSTREFRAKAEKSTREFRSKAEKSTREFRGKAANEASKASSEFVKLARELNWARQTDMKKLETKVTNLAKKVKALEGKLKK